MKNKIEGTVITIVGALFIIFATRIKNPQLANDPGPQLFPYISGIGLVLFGILLLILPKRLFQKDNEKDKPDPAAVKRAILLFGYILLYLIMLYFFGFLISTPVLLFFANGVIGNIKKKYISRTLFSIVITAIIYLLFESFLHVMLPPGVLF